MVSVKHEIIEEFANKIKDFEKGKEHIEILQLINETAKIALGQYKLGNISHKEYKELMEMGIIHEELILQWKVKGYETLCCTRCIDSATKNGNVCICRVPKKFVENEGCLNCNCKGCNGN